MSEASERQPSKSNRRSLWGPGDLVMGVTAALYRREKTGKGSLVDACLLRSGMFSAQLVMVRPSRLMCKAEG